MVVITLGGDDCWTPCETDLTSSSSTRIIPNPKAINLKIDKKRLRRRLKPVVV